LVLLELLVLVLVVLVAVLVLLVVLVVVLLLLVRRDGCALEHTDLSEHSIGRVTLTVSSKLYCLPFQSLNPPLRVWVQKFFGVQRFLRFDCTGYC
jgi:hypothetical protein